MNFYNSGILENVNTKTLDSIISKSHIQVFHKNQMIHFIEDECTNIDIILKGSIEGEHLSQDGSKLIVRNFQENESIGLNIAFSSKPLYVLNFIASNDTKIMSVPSKVIKDLMKVDDNLMNNILQHLSDNSIRIGSRITSEFRVTIKTQLLSYMEKLYIKQQQNPIILPISKVKLSEHLGVSRTSISRVFFSLQQEGYIKMDKKKIHLCEKLLETMIHP